ncbi:hypothetical protein ACRARG_04615 [Pseudooceanicola sp. C21-150M6]|uniref:hypothetical protein n=1 Tax=Pseudooceanicola sp. C21-150M6 TaxID=3434355 RepID=UPI003D7F8927
MTEDEFRTRALVARYAWTCGSLTLDRVAQDMGIFPRRESPDAGKPYTPVIATAEEAHD